MNLTLRFQIIVLFFPLPPRAPSPTLPLLLTHLFNAAQLQSLFLFWTATVSPLTYNNSSVFHLDCCFFLSIHFAVEDVVFNRTHLRWKYTCFLCLQPIYLLHDYCLFFYVFFISMGSIKDKKVVKISRTTREGLSYVLGGTKVDACGSFP